MRSGWPKPWEGRPTTDRRGCGDQSELDSTSAADSLTPYCADCVVAEAMGPLPQPSPTGRGSQFGLIAQPDALRVTGSLSRGERAGVRGSQFGLIALPGALLVTGSLSCSADMVRVYTDHIVLHRRHRAQGLPREGAWGEGQPVRPNRTA